MPRELRYGADLVVRINPPSEALLADCSSARGTPLDDPAAAVAATLANPLDFPPLSSAVFPGDRIAIAVEQSAPQVEKVLAGLMHSLLEGGADPSDITIVYSQCENDSAQESILRGLAPDIREAVGVVLHDPADKENLSYLATTQEGNAIHLNRTLCDADVVLPVSTMRLESSLGYTGIHSALFPAMSDLETQKRFRAPHVLDWPAHQRRRRKEADEAAWKLGVQFTLQIIPGPGNSILHVLAGDCNAVAREGQKLCESAWLFETPQRASLVVATIEGGAEQQTWENFARALYSASKVVVDEGAIVLCTELSQKPGPALRRLARFHSDEELSKEIHRDRTPDAISASLLAETQSRVRVYLLSQLAGEEVEEMGVGHVRQVEEVDRLTRQHDSCILLANAHRAVAAVLSE